VSPQGTDEGEYIKQGSTSSPSLRSGASPRGEAKGAQLPIEALPYFIFLPLPPPFGGPHSPVGEGHSQLSPRGTDEGYCALFLLSPFYYLLASPFKSYGLKGGSQERREAVRTYTKNAVGRADGVFPRFGKKRFTAF